MVLYKYMKPLINEACNVSVNTHVKSKIYLEFTHSISNERRHIRMSNFQISSIFYFTIITFNLHYTILMTFIAIYNIYTIRYLYMHVYVVLLMDFFYVYPLLYPFYTILVNLLLFML